jgi:hypothetical protein
MCHNYRNPKPFKPYTIHFPKPHFHPPRKIDHQTWPKILPNIAFQTHGISFAIIDAPWSKLVSPLQPPSHCHHPHKLIIFVKIHDA